MGFARSFKRSNTRGARLSSAVAWQPPPSSVSSSVLASPRWRGREGGTGKESQQRAPPPPRTGPTPHLGARPGRRAAAVALGWVGKGVRVPGVYPWGGHPVDVLVPAAAAGHTLTTASAPRGIPHLAAPAPAPRCAPRCAPRYAPRNASPPRPLRGACRRGGRQCRGEWALAAFPGCIEPLAGPRAGAGASPSLHFVLHRVPTRRAEEAVRVFGHTPVGRIGSTDLSSRLDGPSARSVVRSRGWEQNCRLPRSV